MQEQGEKKFITSPPDIDVHQKVELQDAEVSEEHQNAFKELCAEFKDIFSVNSSDVGKTPLVEMEIDTGDSPPITQKTCQMGTERVRNFGKSWCYCEKCLTLG